MHDHMITDPRQALEYIKAGNSKVTVVSKKTGKRYTFKVTAPYDRRKCKRDYDAKVRFVALRVDEEKFGKPWMYLGSLRGVVMFAGARGNGGHPAYKVFDWVVGHLSHTANNGKGINEELEIWHSGRCGRCGRELTDPASIERGLGPECAKK